MLSNVVRCLRTMHVFQSLMENSTLEIIGREIVKKCKSSPLAAQTIGGLLRAKHDVRDWNVMLTNEIWLFSLNDNKVIPALRTSYYRLPPHLKSCFVYYCSMYPNNYRFNKDKLILLWMAEGLLEQPKKMRTLEVGSEFFDYLTFRLFFKQFKNDDHQSFVIHDLLHDLAISVAGDFYFRSEEPGKENNIKIHTLHLHIEVFERDASRSEQSSHFIVGKHEENGIKELGELSNLYCGEAAKAIRIVDKTQPTFCHWNGLVSDD
ncbi:putative disease resistance protein RGA4, partial [Mucuna pruriens]